MWNEILALVVLLVLVYGGVVVLPGAPKVIDAVCDRIRHGVQPVVDHLEEEAPEAEAEAVTAKPAKPTPVTTKARTAA